ncbi:MAG: hypothetical protein C4523_07735 [Myxococcales bacterium]|nr:MAG: hypothetical protein C4523_07735 [Myxococcales bacterium]
MTPRLFTVLTVAALAAALGACSGSDSSVSEDGSVCETQFDCGQGFRCINERCVPSTCSTDADCLAGESCVVGPDSQGRCARDETDGDAPPDGDAADGDGPAPVCEPGERRCDGADLQSCERRNGVLDWRFMEECELGCEAGACIVADGDEDLAEPEPDLEPVCTANATRCYSNQVEACAPDGSAWEVADPCNAGTCVEETQGARCGPRLVCQPGMRRCDASGGESVLVCKADGSDWDRLPCAVNWICVDGVCQNNALCTRGRYRCNGNSVERCATTGQAWEHVRTCGESETCACQTYVGSECNLADCIGNVICQPLIETRCLGNVVQHCAADGKAWANWQDCAADGLTCQNGQCI